MIFKSFVLLFFFDLIPINPVADLALNVVEIKLDFNKRTALSVTTVLNYFYFTCLHLLGIHKELNHPSITWIYLYNIWNYEILYLCILKMILNISKCLIKNVFYREEVSIHLKSKLYQISQTFIKIFVCFKHLIRRHPRYYNMK